MTTSPNPSTVISVPPSTKVQSPIGAPSVLVPDNLQPLQSTQNNNGKVALVNLPSLSTIITNPA